MKDIHPTYHEGVATTCLNCNTEHKLGGTRTDITVEICSQCHPFYTGKKVLIDTEGRVDKFRVKMENAGSRTKKVRKKKTLEEKVNEELADQLKTEKAKEAKEEAKAQA